MGTLKCTLHNYDGINWTSKNGDLASNDIVADLVICFGSKKILERTDIYSQLRSRFLCEQIAMCTTSGEIINTQVQDDSLVAISICFAKTKVISAEVDISDNKDSYEAGLSLIGKLPKENLNYIFILSDGNLVNGSELVKGLNQAVDNKILIRTNNRHEKYSTIQNLFFFVSVNLRCIKCFYNYFSAISVLLKI